MVGTREESDGIWGKILVSDLAFRSSTSLISFLMESSILPGNSMQGAYTILEDN